MHCSILDDKPNTIQLHWFTIWQIAPKACYWNMSKNMQTPDRNHFTLRRECSPIHNCVIHSWVSDKNSVVIIITWQSVLNCVLVKNKIYWLWNSILAFLPENSFLCSARNFILMTSTVKNQTNKQKTIPYYWVLQTEQVWQVYFSLRFIIYCESVWVCVRWLCSSCESNGHMVASLADQAHTPFQRMFVTSQDWGKKSLRGQRGVHVGTCGACAGFTSVSCSGWCMSVVLCLLLSLFWNITIYKAHWHARCNPGLCRLKRGRN